MTTAPKTFRTATAAAMAAGARPYVKIGCGRAAIYVVGDFSSLDSIELIGPAELPTGKPRELTGQVTLRHLERLGNANHAAADPKWQSRATAFPGEAPAREPSLVAIAENWRDFDRRAAEAVAVAHCGAIDTRGEGLSIGEIETVLRDTRGPARDVREA